MKSNKKQFHLKKFFILVGIAMILLTIALGYHMQQTVEAKQINVLPVGIPVTFPDSNSDLAMSIYLTDGQEAAGTFDLFVPEKGYYHGIVSLQESGDHIIHPQGTIETLFYPLTGDIPISKTIRMEGEIDNAHISASLSFWIDDTQYHLVAKQPDASSVNSITNDVGQMFVKHDWDTLYNKLSSDVQNTVSQSDFGNLLSTQNIIDVSTTEQATIQNISGTYYSSQPVNLTIQNDDGTTSQFTSTLYFVWEDGSWKLLSTDTPQ